MLHRTLIALVAVGALFVTSCADDDTGDTTPLTSIDQDQDPQRDRDRDRIHQSLISTLEACGDQDRDRLQTQSQTQLQDQLQEARYRYAAGTAFEVLDETVTFEGDRATVQTRLRIREADRETVEAELRWRFEQTEEGWQLRELPLCLDGGPTPSTIRERDRTS